MAETAGALQHGAILKEEQPPGAARTYSRSCVETVDANTLAFDLLADGVVVDDTRCCVLTEI
jgi:hypothetical protein